MLKKLIIVPIHNFYSDYRSPLPNKVKLHNDFVLKKFNPNILQSALSFFNNSFSARQVRDLSSCKYALFYKYFTDSDSSDTPKEHLEKIYRFIQTLRLVKQTRALPTIFHFQLLDREKIPLQLVDGSFYNISLSASTSPGDQHFTKSDGYKIKKYFKKIDELYEKYGHSYNKVLNSIFFFEISFHNTFYKPRMVSFITALESLFNTSDQQVGFTLKLRCSCFLEKNKEKRLELAKKIKSIYKLRSLYVHGQSTPSEILNDAEKQKELLISAEDISRKCIQKIISNNLEDIFSNKELLDTEFEKLELGLKSSLN